MGAQDTDLDIFDTAPARSSKRMIWITFFAVAAIVVWSGIAELDRVVRADGQVVPSARTQIVQSLEGGIIADILVAEGDTIATGQELVRLDQTRFESSVGELEQEITSLELRQHRLLAEINETPSLSLPDDLVTRRPDLAEIEQQVFATRTETFYQRREDFAHLIDLRAEEVEILRPLAANGAVPDLQLLSAEVSLAQLRMDRQQFVSEYTRELTENLSSTTAELETLRQSIAARHDQLRRTILRSPSDGTINQLFFSTVGAVVGPGEPVLEITPSEDDIQIEVRVGPEDIGYVTDGMRATLKITAYDFASFGTLSGSVARVGSDTVADPLDPNAPPAFAVSIDLDADALQSWRGRDLQLRPGMVVTAELQAGSDRILDYVFRPLLRARDALSEI